MKKIILALFISLSFTMVTKAQTTIQFLEGDTVWVNGEETNADIYRFTHIKFTGADTTTFVWVREEVNVPNGWETAVCDINLCYLSNVSTEEFKLNPNQEGELYPHFYTNNTTGTGSLRIVIYEKENPANADTCVYMMRSFGVGISSVVKADIKVYPNPARTTMTVDLPDNITGGTVEVYDMLGNKVLMNNVSGDEHVVNVANLPVGKYVLRYIDQNGTAYNKRFQKVN